MSDTQIEQSATALVDAPVSTPVDEVEVDALTEALDTLAKAMNKDAPKYSKGKGKQVMLFDAEEDEDTEDSEDEEDDSEDEEDEEDMEKGLRMYGIEEAMKAMAAGTDKIVGDMEKRMHALMKGMETMLQEIKGMKGEQSAMAKSLGAALNAPVAPRAALSVVAAPVAPAPAAPTRGELLSKALTKLQDPSVDNARKARLRSAVSLLESGADPRTLDSLVNG